MTKGEPLSTLQGDGGPDRPEYKKLMSTGPAQFGNNGIQNKDQLKSEIDRMINVLRSK